MTKVIDIDPNTRLKKQGLEEIITILTALDPKKLEGMVVFYQYGDQYTGIIDQGVDFGLLGYVDACSSELKQSLLVESDLPVDLMLDPDDA